MTYHCSTKENNAEPICGVLVAAGDIVVPLDEILSDDRRHFNCHDCAEELARLAGGSTRRKRPFVEVDDD